MTRMTPKEVQELYEEAHSKLTYNPQTGKFHWRVDGSRGIKAGDEAMTSVTSGSGYLRGTLLGKYRKAHRIAWLMTHGYWPEHGLDHINRDKKDNRMINLRVATPMCNMRNSNLRATSRTGVKGVDIFKGTYRARIRINGVQHYLGYSDDLLEAACLRLAAEQAVDWPGCESNSPARQFVERSIGRA